MTQEDSRWVLVTGVFNGLHPEHVALLKYASGYGPVMVGINGDVYNTGKNGVRAIPAEHRAYMLNAIRFVDRVAVFDEPDPSELILQIKPSYYIKGPDYKGLPLIEEAACKVTGTVVLFRPGTYTYASRFVFHA